MAPISQDEKQIILARMIRELAKAREVAKRDGLDMLAFLIAQAEDEAQSELVRLESDIFPDDE